MKLKNMWVVGAELLAIFALVVIALVIGDLMSEPQSTILYFMQGR